MNTKRIVSIFLVCTIAFSYIGITDFSLYSSAETVISDILAEENYLPDEKKAEDVTPADGTTDVAFSEVQGSLEPLNIEPYSGISLMATSTDSNIIAGIKQFQQYINANLPSAYLGTALAVDGSCGPATQTAAVKLVQYKLNQAGASLTIDGGFGTASQQAFTTYVGAIERYDTGVWVYILQGLMYCHAYNPQGFDGSYGVNGGTGLLNAVNLFKSVNKISEGSSGYAGVETMKCLLWKAPLRVVEDGVYYIKNNYSGKYLNVRGTGITNLTHVDQYGKLPTTSNSYLRQLWKIYYLGNGFYTIRPMHKLNMGLYGSSGGFVAQGIGTTDTYDYIGQNARWTISLSDGFYVFKNNGEDRKTLSILKESTNDGVNAVALQDSGLAIQRWSLEKITNPPSGILVYVNNLLASGNIKRWIGNNSTYSISSLGLTLASYSPSDISQDFYWDSYDDNIATVNSITGDVTSVASGEVTIIAVKRTTGSSFEIKIEVTGISEGIHLIQNTSTDKFVDIEGQIMSEGTKIHQWQFHGGPTQQWEFVLEYGTGYFKIRSVNGSNLYMGISGDSTEADTYSVLRASPLSSGMWWKVTQNTDGSFYLTAQCGEINNKRLALASSSDSNGIDLQQKDISVFNYSKWNIYDRKDYAFSFIGSIDDLPYMTTLLGEMETSFNNAGYVGYGSTRSSSADCLALMKSVKVFASECHGDPTWIKMYDSDYLTLDYINSLPSGVFSDLDLVVFGACETGVGRASQDNMVNAMKNKGAKVVIGFTSKADPDEICIWLKHFLNSIAAGKTVSSAMDYADVKTTEEYSDSDRTTADVDRYVCGDTNVKIL